MPPVHGKVRQIWSKPVPDRLAPVKTGALQANLNLKNKLLQNRIDYLLSIAL